MTSQQIFFDDKGLLRSGFRFAIFAAAFFVAAMILNAIAFAVLTLIGRSSETDSAAFLAATSMMSLIAALVIGWLCGKYLEDLPFRALGASFTGPWVQHLLVGLVSGIAALGFAVLIAWAFGGLSFVRSLDVDQRVMTYQIAATFLVFALGAAFEEALFRGYVLQTFARSGLAWLAIVLTSVFFGMVHLGNPNATAISTVNTILAGVMFALAYLRMRDLWFPFGMHLTWNWMQGSIFGIEVSGMNDIAGYTLLKEVDRGPVWLTGESYGIEGGIACTISLVAAIILIRIMPKRPES